MATSLEDVTARRYDRETGHGPENMATLQNLAINTLAVVGSALLSLATVIAARSSG